MRAHRGLQARRSRGGQAAQVCDAVGGCGGGERIERVALRGAAGDDQLAQARVRHAACRAVRVERLAARHA